MKKIYDVNDFLYETRNKKTELDGVLLPWVRIPAKMEDGYCVSIQASEYHYCSPRNNEGPWNSMELGYPNEWDELIDEYAEDPHSYKTVFGYVPVGVVNKLIEKHGGIILED